MRITSGPVPIPGYQLAIRYLASHGAVFPTALVLLPGGLGRAHTAKERVQGAAWWRGGSMGMWLMLK